MTKVKVLSITSLILISFLCTGQINRYVPGYVVKIDGDTLKGFIDDTRITELHTVVWFKASETQHEKDIFYPSTIKAFGFRNNPQVVFEAKQKIAFTNSANKPDTLDIFASMLASGEVSLFRYQDKSKAEHYFIEKAGKAYELRNKTLLLVGEGGTVHKKHSKDFNGLLNILLGDCDQKSYNLSYSPKKFVQIVNDYNLCRAEKNSQHVVETRDALIFHSQGNLIDTVKDVQVTVLVKGGVSLLLYEDSVSRKHYFVEKGTKIAELEDRTNFTIMPGGEVMRSRDKSYNRILEEFIGDCSDRSYNLDFDARLFSRSVMTYNLCKSKSVSVHGNQKVRVSFGLRAGMSYSTLRFSETQYYNSINGQPTPVPLRFQEYTAEPLQHLSPLAGLNWNLESWRNRHISVDLGFQFRGYHWKSSLVDIKLVSLELPGCVKWSILLKKRFRPFINLGLTYSKALSTTSSLSYSEPYTTRPSTFRFAVGGGIDYVNRNSKKISLGVRWEESAGFINSTNLTSTLHTSNFYVSCPFVFSKDPR